jgi:hypothetical protein
MHMPTYACCAKDARMCCVAVWLLALPTLDLSLCSVLCLLSHVPRWGRAAESWGDQVALLEPHRSPTVRVTYRYAHVC